MRTVFAVGLIALMVVGQDLASSRLARSSRAGSEVPTFDVSLDPDTLLSWIVSSEPRVEIGGTAEDTRYQLFGVVDAARLSNGEVVLANEGSHELRFYSKEGAYLSAIGREGGGPGEFRRLSGLQVGSGDSIYVFDSRLQRISIFDRHGALERTIVVPSAIAPLSFVGRFSDNRWYAQDEDRLVPSLPGAIRRDTASLIGLDSAFEERHLISEVPGLMTASFRGPSGTSYRWAPFSPSPIHDVFGKCLYVGSGDEFAVRIFRSDGLLLSVVGGAGERRAVSPELRNQWLEDLIVSQIPEEAREGARQVLGRIPMPEKLPVYNDLVVDAAGYIWLQEYRPQSGSSRWWTGAGRSWIILNPDGEKLGRIETPAALEVYEVGLDYIIGGWQDELGEEFLRIYDIDRPHEANVLSPKRCR